MSRFTIRVAEALPSPARQIASVREPIRIAAVQAKWRSDPAEHLLALEEAIHLAATHGAKIVCLQELTLSPYFALVPDALEQARAFEEDPLDGPTQHFAWRVAKDTGCVVHASLYERANDGGLGFNTAIAIAPDGTLLARTRKLHIPEFPGYHEHLYFRPGNTGTPVIEVAGARFGFPTCWDQWFPELARIYSLEGAEVLVYPTAIGSEQDLEAFDTQPLWEQMIRANGLANATFMVAVNRVGEESLHGQRMRFYGSSFISDPYGRLLVRADRDEETVLIADLDLDQRRDWLAFGLFETRRPSQYGKLLSGNGRT